MLEQYKIIQPQIVEAIQFTLDFFIQVPPYYSEGIVKRDSTSVYVLPTPDAGGWVNPDNAYIGDWIVYTCKGFRRKVYTNEHFHQIYEKTS